MLRPVAVPLASYSRTAAAHPLGREVQRTTLKSATHSFHIVTAGAYTVNVLSDAGRTVQRIVVD